MWQESVDLGIVSAPVWLFAATCALTFGTMTYIGTRKSFKDCDLATGRLPIIYGMVAAVLSLFYIWATREYAVLRTPEVIPSSVSENWRIVYHLGLISLLLMITATDLKSYFILEWVCYLGMAMGILGAFVSGELQMIHVWVDWNEEIPQLRGPYFPPWLAPHPHLHGLAWSSGGLAIGAVVTWLTRRLSTLVLGTPALGSGDILLMAMVGAFLGWQPTLVAFALAPIFAMAVGGAVRAVGNRPILPYGPFLALGAISTLFAWRWIWMAEFPLTMQPDPPRESIFAVRRFFGDWVSLLAMAGIAVTLLVVLLGLLRFYKSLDLSGVNK